jgi:replicative DNA helicase
MIDAAEAAVTEMIGSAMSGTAFEPPSAAAAPEVLLSSEKFEFDAEFQSKVALQAMRNLDFMRKVAHLLQPSYFENAGEAAMVNIALRYYKSYGSVPTALAAKELFAEDLRNKVIRSDTRAAAMEAFKHCFAPVADLSDSTFIAERVAKFAQHQAIGAAILESVDLLDRKEFDKIAKKVKAACEVGINTHGEEYDYYERIDERTAERADRLAGKLPPTGITTGHRLIDELLYHRGWGRKELSVILGGAKAGKTTFLINCAKAASLAGFNVLYVTCEVAARIIAERMDATISDVEVKNLMARMHDVAGKVKATMPRAGKVKFAGYPSGTLTPTMLRALIDSYKSPRMNGDGTVREPVQFDLVVVDYADIMAPDFRTQDAIENSKSIYLALRAIADEENVAMLSATQTNREGMKSTVATATHVADDINKVRTVDIMISINITDEERANGEARLYFAASRNQAGGFTIFVKQELEKMKFIASIIRVE